MFIETVPNRTSPPAILLRESYRDEAGKAQKRTPANLSTLKVQTPSSSVRAVLELDAVAEREVYSALDCLLEQQPRVESALARRHLKNGTLVLYDVRSSYLEGRKCPLAQQ